MRETEALSQTPTGLKAFGNFKNPADVVMRTQTHAHAHTHTFPVFNPFLVSSETWVHINKLMCKSVLLWIHTYLYGDSSLCPTCIEVSIILFEWDNTGGRAVLIYLNSTTYRFWQHSTLTYCFSGWNCSRQVGVPSHFLMRVQSRRCWCRTICPCLSITRSLVGTTTIKA